MTVAAGLLRSRPSRNERFGPVDDEAMPGKHLCRAGVAAWLDTAFALNKTLASVRHVGCRFEGKPRCDDTMST